jgi:hypothetical protein
MNGNAAEERNVRIARTQMSENEIMREFLNSHAVKESEVYDYAFRKKSANELMWSLSRFCRVLDRIINRAKTREAEKRLRIERNKKLTSIAKAV